ncbi:glycosyltransferase family 4 protein [Dolichospermum planctonicum UHCC 0167]|uniref:glycosyltransferase family 4 protein n=1 Tax=Dolichospermum planctonicum TaxID=136072 RepID=UPI00144375C2|nr:glycosyltransferase family 4 protein [Dolichospermum planctonicum]MCW9680029.1 glycosyltransferase family 4 protein [Dolichospermum planctonicum UHCC 0167]
MKVGITIRTFYPQSGGLQAHAEKLAKELIANGHQVTIVTRSVSHTPSYQDYFFFSESISKTNINGLDVDVLKHSPVFHGLMWVISKCIGRPSLRKFAIQLVELIFTQQLVNILQEVDVIHHVGQAHELIGFAAAAAAHNLKIPFLIQPTLHPGQWGDSPLDLHLYNLADHLLVHSKFEQNCLKKAGITGSFHVVGNGIDNCTSGDADCFRKKYGIDGDIILFLGRKTIDKGYSLVKEAFNLTLTQYKDTSLVCMGPSVVKSNDKIEGGILELGFGTEQEKHDAIAACKILCVPSEGESFGLVYMEAGLYSKPIIARKLPVLAELLGEQEAALLIGKAYGENNQVNLDAKELSSAMLKLLNDSDLSIKIGENAYRVAREFLWSKIVIRFEAAYRQAIANNITQYHKETKIAQI